ncbi:MAG: hypothetical protein DMF13_05255 [Verrucomicrobia bacterium]|nr:MAG: hypothetical protein DMF13_05255 [Verrucomicrobiota bacterium]
MTPLAFWGAHAPSRAHCGASPQCSEKRKVCDGEGAIASTRGACAPQHPKKRLAGERAAVHSATQN